ncbi:hypothetical protein [Streptococcus pluranimalium]|uniref:Uncharacterized protein n=1 Tax=Streptococcus pluranimalium TaxID=82348 RepID=A0A345VIE3_9STRE|nr:hypothetical protein [Streptococcus pluranimalium]AXJ12495.1 hypothetical protein Sp14A_05650 [Streptococcus pluranimalium]
MQVTIKIDGASADELFAVGPNDLLNYFLPEALGVKKEDVVSIYMSDGKRKQKKAKTLYLWKVTQYIKTITTEFAKPVEEVE